MFERFTDKARKIVILAKAKATERGDDQIRPVHMLYGWPPPTAWPPGR